MSEDRSTATRVRERNRRGDGRRLQEDLVVTAVRLVESHGHAQVSLRAVAREVGVAPTSVYLHFDDVEGVLAAVMSRGFEELARSTTRAASGVDGPLEELRARMFAYCRFALEHPRLYEFMFRGDLPGPVAREGVDTPGLRSFATLHTLVERVVGVGTGRSHEDSQLLATLVWTSMHGLVLARISRPTFAWAPLEVLVRESIDRLLGVTLDAKGAVNAK